MSYDSLSLADLKPRALAARAESERRTLLAAGRSLRTQNKSRAQLRREAQRTLEKLVPAQEAALQKRGKLDASFDAKRLAYNAALLKYEEKRALLNAHLDAVSGGIAEARQLLEANAPLPFKWAPGELASDGSV